MVNDFDPTTNRIPFGLLEDDEREALKAWLHGFQIYYAGEWINLNHLRWSAGSVYRGKPAPVMETKWVTFYDSGEAGATYLSKEAALDRAKKGKDVIGIVRVDVCNGVPTFTFEPISKGE